MIKSINKLKILLEITIFLIIMVFTFFILKGNLPYILSLIAIALFYKLINILHYKKDDKLTKIRERNNYKSLPIFYVLEIIILICLIFFSYSLYKDIKQNASIQIWAISILVIGWIIEILMIYYSYQSHKDAKLRKPISKIEEQKILFNETESIKKNLNNTFIFLILISIIQFIFNKSHNYINIIVSILFFLFFYLLMRIVLDKNRKISDKTLTIIIILLSLLLIGLIILIIFINALFSNPKSDNAIICRSKNLFPVNGIPGLQYCEKDSDCIKVTDRNSCCDECQGGKDNSINKKHLEYWECLRRQNNKCSQETCNSSIIKPGCYSKAICDKNICSTAN